MLAKQSCPSLVLFSSSFLFTGSVLIHLMFSWTCPIESPSIFYSSLLVHSQLFTRQHQLHCPRTSFFFLCNRVHSPILKQNTKGEYIFLELFKKILSFKFGPHAWFFIPKPCFVTGSNDHKYSCLTFNLYELHQIIRCIIKEYLNTKLNTTFIWPALEKNKTSDKTMWEKKTPPWNT